MPLPHAANLVLHLQSSVQSSPHSAPQPLSSARSAAPACAVCHGTDLSHDEVQDAGALFLHECRRCAHRWTSRAEPVQDERVPMVASRRRGAHRLAPAARAEVASAA